MSILNVNTIQPVGSAQTVTVSATDLKIGTTTLSSGGSGVFVGNVTGNINSTGVSTVTTLRGSSNTISIPTGHKIVGTDIGSVRAPGTIIQVVSTDYSSTVSSTSGTPADVSGFSATITPSSSSNKILVYVSVRLGAANDGYPYILLKRNGTTIGSGNQATGSRINTFLSFTQTALGAGTAPFRAEQPSRMFLDSPASTSALTYQIALASPYAGFTGYINRQDNQSDNVFIQYPASNITLMEVSV
jgi:hypothetical protein